MPFPYVDTDAFERELQYTQADFPGVADESEWNALLDEALKTESERVEAYTSGQSWRNSDSVPYIIRAAVIRLARQRIAAIREDGISSEDLVSGAGYDYRPPQEIRNEVIEMLDEADYRDAVPAISIPDLK